MLLSAVSFLVVAQSSSEIPEGLMNNPVQYKTVITLAVFLEGLKMTYRESKHVALNCILYNKL